MAGRRRCGRRRGWSEWTGAGENAVKTLFLSPRQCDPPDTGAKLREYHLARQLSLRGEVDLLAFHAGLPFAPSYCRRAETLSRPSRYTPGKIAAGLLSSQPLSLLNYHSSEMAAAVERTVVGTVYDTIVVESVHMASYRHLLSRATGRPLIVYNWHNIESELMERFAANTSNLAKKLYAQVTAGRLRRLEGELCRSAVGHVVCSERERTAVLASYPGARVAVVRNGVDLAAFGGAGTEAGQRRRVLFVGAMDYYPNIAAVEFFARQHWPGLQAAHPELRFTIVGSNPVETVRSLSGLPGVEVTGTVAEVTSFYREAAVVVVPLLEGGGTRLKIVEAMAAGVPVVSTPAGAEGIEVEGGKQLLLLAPEEDWAAAIGGLLADSARAQRLAEEGREFAAGRYGWDRIGAEFAAILEQWRRA